VLISDFLEINPIISHSSKMREHIQNSNKNRNLCCWLYLSFMEFLYS